MPGTFGSSLSRSILRLSSSPNGPAAQDGHTAHHAASVRVSSEGSRLHAEENKLGLWGVIGTEKTQLTS